MIFSDAGSTSMHVIYGENELDYLIVRTTDARTTNHILHQHLAGMVLKHRKFTGRLKGTSDRKIPRIMSTIRHRPYHEYDQKFDRSCHLCRISFRSYSVSLCRRLFNTTNLGKVTALTIASSRLIEAIIMDRLRSKFE